MALLTIRVPHETSRLLAALDVPGEKEDVAYLHITVLYFGKDTPIEEVLKAIDATLQVTSKTVPFMVKTRSISHFDSEGSIPVMCPIESTALHEFQERVKSAFDAKGVNYSKKFPDYHPHVTLSYVDPPLPSGTDEDFTTPLEWSASSVTLWGGEHGDDVLSCEFTFCGPFTSKEASMRNTVNAARLRGILTGTA